MTTEKTYPNHFSQADINSIVFINAYIEQSKMAQAELSRLAIIDPSTFSQILNGKYPSSPSKFLKKVTETIKRKQVSGNLKTPIVQTSFYDLVITACEHARVFKNFAVVTAAIGVGKTCSLKDYAQKDENVFFIECMATMTISSFITKLTDLVLKREVKGSSQKKVDAIIDYLSETDSLLILDEPEKLKGKNSLDILEIVRRIRDLAKVGVVLSGNGDLYGLVTQNKGAFSQIGSRCSFKVGTITGINLNDVKGLLAAAFPNEINDLVFDDVAKALFKAAQEKGVAEKNGCSARVIVEQFFTGMKAYKHQSKEGITVGFINSIGKDALNMPTDKNGTLLCLKTPVTAGA